MQVSQQLLLLNISYIEVSRDALAPPVLSSLSKKDQDASGSAGMKSLREIALLGAGVSWLLSFTTIVSADEAEHGLECPSYP
ncbi:cytochrome c1-2, heme protein, mitochondrial [Tanacetum coccineum]